jgi:WD40 repeat protein
VYLWDTATGKMLRQIEVAADAGTKQSRRNIDYLLDLSAVFDFQFVPHARSLATASGDGVLRVWDVATGQELRRWDTSDFVRHVAFAPDGMTLAALGSGHTVRLWDPATGKERDYPSHRQGFHVLDLSPDGRTLASAGMDRDVRLWDTTTGQQLHQLTADKGDVFTLHFEVDGGALTALGDDGKSRTWDVATGKVLRQLPLPLKEGDRMGVLSHALSPNGKTWASVVEDSSTNIVLWDAATGKKRQLLVGDYWINALTFSPDSRTVFCWRGYNWVRSWDVATGKGRRGFAAGENSCYAGSFSPDGNWFACLGIAGPLFLYDMATGELVHQLHVPGKCDIRPNSPSPSFAYSPDGRALAVADSDGTIHLVELASGKFRRHLAGGHQSGICALLFSADGQRLISGSADMTALVWDIARRLNADGKPLSAADLDACWKNLAGDDAETADRAIRRLAASPIESLPYLAKKLQPAVPADARRVAELIRDLDDDRFVVRERASRELEKLGEMATAMCRKALASELSAEARQRLEALLKQQEQERLTPSRQHLRILRALQALEFAGTPEARQLVQKLADGVAEAFITREAKTTLLPLTRQTAIKP